MTNARASKSKAFRNIDSIADEYERCEEKSSELASSQIRIVAVLLLSGLLLLLILPRVIQEIEFFGRLESVPSEILNTAQVSLSLLEANYTEMKIEVEGISERLSLLEKDRESVSSSIATLEGKVRSSLSGTYSIWKNDPPDQLSGQYQITSSRKLSESETAIFGFTGGGR